MGATYVISKESGNVPTDGLLAWYKLDGDTTDSSGNGYDSIDSNISGYATGKFSQGANLADTDEYINLPIALNSFYLTSFTLSLWVNPSIGGRVFYMRKSVSTSPTLFYLELIDNGSGTGFTVTITIGVVGGNQIITGTTEFSYNSLLNIIVSAPDKNNINLYLNNAFEGTNFLSTLQRVSTFQTQLSIGDGYLSGSQLTTATGIYDQVVLYNREITEVERALLYEGVETKLIRVN